ncbi:MAG: hypothetical protein PSX71_03470 [bacterium]|nr:hypothetical protein [bacterium]
MRFLLVVIPLLMPVATLAVEPASPSTPASYVSPFSTYQGWTEPAVRDWQETHALVTEPSGETSHSMSDMPAAPASPEAAPSATPAGHMMHGDRK